MRCGRCLRRSPPGREPGGELCWQAKCWSLGLLRRIGIEGSEKSVWKLGLTGCWPYRVMRNFFWKVQKMLDFRQSGALFPDAEQAGRFYLEMAQAGDVVLVKGSRGVRLEKAIAVILNGFHTLTVKDSVAKDAGAAAGDSQDGFNSRETRQRNEFET